MDDIIGIFWITDYFAVVGSITDVFMYNCLTSIAGIIIAIVLYTLGLLIYLICRLIYEGFKALFQGKFWLAPLYWAIPGILFFLGWTNGLGSLVNDAIAVKITSGKPGTIKGYFIFPNNNKACRHNWKHNWITLKPGEFLVPNELRGNVIEDIECGFYLFEPDVRYLRWKNLAPLQTYINLERKKRENGAYGTELVSDIQTNEGVVLQYKPIPYRDGGPMIIWTVDKYLLFGEATWHGVSLEVLYHWWLTTASEHY